MKKYCAMFSEGSKVNQIICAVLINLPLLSYGMSIAWVSPMTLLLQSERSPIGRRVSDTEMSWIASLPYMTCVPCTIFMSLLIDKWGRKIITMNISVTYIISWSLLLISSETWAFIVARSLVGICTASCFVVCPIYVKETSDNNIRGALGTLLILFFTVGNLMMYVLGDLLSYNTLLWGSLIIPIAHLLLFLAMPESPSFLLKKGKKTEATKALAWLRCREDTDKIVTDEIESQLKEQTLDGQNEKHVLKAIFQDRTLRKAFWIGIIVTFARETCGAVPLVSFAGYVFENASKTSALTLTPNQQAMLMGVVQVVGCSVASSVVEHAGRRPLLIVTSVVSGCSMGALGTWFLANKYGIIVPPWIPVTSLCLCVFCDAAGLQPISIVVLNEIFSYKYRSTVTAIAMALTSGFAALQVFLFMPVANLVGVHVSFYFFTVVCLVTAFYVTFKVPETKKRTLEQIYEVLSRK